MSNKPDISIHLGAGVNTVTVDGRTFDRNAMKPADAHKLRRMITAAMGEVYGQ